MQIETYSQFEHRILSALDSHIAVLDESGNITQVNQAWAGFAERNGAAASCTGVGVNYFEVCRARGATAEVEQILSGVQAVIDGSAPHFHAEYTCPSPTETFWFELSVNPLPKPERGVVVCHTDISELKRTRDEYAVVLDSARAILWRATLPGFHTTFTSKHGEEILGFPAEAWVANPSLWVDRIHPEDRPWVLAFTSKACKEQQNHDFEYRMIAADGHIVWLRNIVNVIVEHGRATQVIGISVDISERKQAEELTFMMSRKLVEVEERERRRIGRELHDDINQRLAMLALELEQLQDNPTEVDSRLKELRKQTVELSHDVQALSHELHSSKLEYLGVVKAIKSLCGEFAERHKMEVDLRADVRNPMGPDIGLALFRVLQEALQNARKYSGQNRVEVELTERSNEVHLIVRDSGKGFDVEAAMEGKGLGLTSMRERVRLVNGSISIKSKPMSGTAIEVVVPFDRQSQQLAG
jgi:PAS domain S-box-containing protein